MPEKSLTVATYAAGASLAAITLIYVFGPTYFLDTQKKGVVGLSNPANDCFINSVLQALAGLGDLRLYLIRETHRRDLDDGLVYSQVIPPEEWQAAVGSADGAQASKKMPAWKIEGLQRGIVTRGLKDILDSLNERPIYKKTISAAPFVRTLEQAFQQRISRQQQDAQEFLQVVAERLCDEYHAGRRARQFANRRGEPPLVVSIVGPVDDFEGSVAGKGEARGEDEDEDEDEDGFPLEGQFESQIECLTCGFKPRPTESTFCTLNLNVPQTSATTLNTCFDGMFKTEYIDDFKCEKCRLLHAVTVYEAEAKKSTPDTLVTKAQAAVTKLQVAIDTDPEHPPKDVELPDMRHAPKRRIARHIRLTKFPKVLAVHLSRSIYDTSNYSQKNSAKVSFPERLSLGGLLQQKKYKLLGLVTHKGSHHSGHYESFRRQNVYPPFSNPNTFQPSGPYSGTATPISTPEVRALQQKPGENTTPTSTLDLPSLEPGAVADSSASSPVSATVPSSPPNFGWSSSGKSSPLSGSRRSGLAPNPRDRETDANSLRSVAASARSTLSKIASRPSSRADNSAAVLSANAPPASKKPPGTTKPKRKKTSDRWWRISDEKVKEANTRDVLSMQREVYLLFYELEKD
ncbi:ubiquitin c-terminal hydrolase [Rhypophila decipiens]|uniref:Ubiquitin carboxyl-terminal hydrolase n=1 Tax=Rhypophila decipiens TaxID=261697 RepID=A0AAN6XX60_9PEZI|nr:ubiquitin c-terminal hydrolase [Rhypophila decipiens]